MRLSVSLSLALTLFLAAPGRDARAASSNMQWAEVNCKAGRYAEAAKKLQAVLAGTGEAEKPAARRLLAEVFLITGKYDQVAELFKDPGVEELVLVGRAHMARGRYAKAGGAFEKAFAKSEQKSVAARVELIGYWETTGQEDMAELARTWFFQNYRKISRIRYARKDGTEVTDPREMIILARGLASRDPQGAINALTVAQKKSEGDVEPYVRSFFMFMEKFNWNQAAAELRHAVRVNKRHPEVQLGNAYYLWSRKKDAENAEKALKEALKVNPHMVAARVMMAHLHLFDDEYQEARKELDAALAVNPRDLEALSTLAAYHYDAGETESFEATCKKVLGINPRYAGLYNTIAGSCERKRQFPQAREFYKKAIEIDPGGWRGYYGAGMSLVRRGEDAAGKKLLEKAFKLNKYNLFCRNMLVVLDKLVPPEGYASKFADMKTEHFVVRAPRKDAPFLLPYYARALEEAYAKFKAKYKFTPENPTVVEVFSKHGDFSARTTGLPLIGADGACFGKLVTLDSPRVWQAGSVPLFNWATVAEHELMHVFSLQITNYRIPRWFTEGLSVYEEGVPRLELDRLFAGAVRNGRLIKVKDLNRQMTRPTARMNPLLAYYQARRVVEFIYGEYGMEGMRKLLAEFKARRKVEEAIPNALGLSLEEFEAKVLAHQEKFAAEKVRVSGAPDGATRLKLELEVKENPDDPVKLAALASACLQGRRPDYDSAAKYAGRAVEKGGGGPGVARAHAVLGYIAYHRDKKFRRARRHFEKAVAADPRNAAANLYLGICAGKEGMSELAVRHLQKAKELAPRDIGKVNAYEELYKVYRDMDRDAEALAAMRERVAVDKRGYEQAVKLGKLALGAKNWKLASWAAWQAVRVDPFKPDPHLVWGEAAEKSKDFKAAEREWRLASLADAANAEARMGLARALLGQGKKAEARRAAEEARALEPDRPDIKKFIEEIGPIDETELIKKELKKIEKPAEDLKPGDVEDLIDKLRKPGTGFEEPEKKKKPPEKKEPPRVIRELEKVDACAPAGRLVA